MADETRANPAELGRAAQLSLDESKDLFEGLRHAREDLSLPADAIGNTFSTGQVATAHTEVVDAAGTAVERLIAVLEQDVEALYRTAFSYQEEDREAAEDLRQQYPNIPV